MQEPKWYVVHTRTGYENKVKADLEKTVENRNMGDLIVEIRVPTEEVVEVKGGKRKVSQRRIYPCYIMVKMIMTSEIWYIVRNAGGVTGFVGPGSDPVPLSEEEVAAMGVERLPIIIEVEVGEYLRLVAGIVLDGVRIAHDAFALVFGQIKSLGQL